MPVYIQLIIIIIIIGVFFSFRFKQKGTKMCGRALWFSGHAFINKQNKLIRMNGERSAIVLQSSFHSLFGFFSCVCVCVGGVYSILMIQLT